MSPCEEQVTKELVEGRRAPESLVIGRNMKWHRYAKYRAKSSAQIIRKVTVVFN